MATLPTTHDRKASEVAKSSGESSAKPAVQVPVLVESNHVTAQKEEIDTPSYGEAANQMDGNTTVYLKGLRLHLITAAVCVSLFLTNLEIPIVTTSLISITNDLHSFSDTSWIISSYMLGYVSMLIIWAKLSDIFGRKLFVIAAVLVFTVFSGACGAAQSMTQLIILRAFQGLGGGGTFALGSVIIMELVPQESYAKYTSLVSVVFSMSLLLGPIIGGALNHSSTWRWIFLLNVPLGAWAAAVHFFCLPFDFPFQGQQTTHFKTYKNVGQLFSRETFGRVDFLGASLLFIATTLLVAALEEAGLSFAWKSAFVISLLTVSGLTWIAFVFWERIVTLRRNSTEPVFPWRLMTSRIWMGMTLNALFLGAPWFVTIFQLPQRFIVVNNASALGAGLRLIPFTLAAPVGSIISATIAGKAKVPPIYLVLLASSIQVIGFGLLSSLPLSEIEPNAQYGYQVIAGFGVGINISTLLLMTPFSIAEKRDNAVALSSVSQFRMLGGVIGLAIVTAAYKGYVNSRIEQILTREQSDRLFDSAAAIATFEPQIQERIKIIFAGGYNLQFRILIAFAAAQIPSSMLMWQKKQIVV